jgi:hypothetical protein
MVLAEAVGHPLPIHEAIEKETAASGPTVTFHFLGCSFCVVYLSDRSDRVAA